MEREPIAKWRIVVTVLTPQSDGQLEVDSLAELERYIDDGSAIGTWHVESGEVVPPEQVEAELLAIGNDGTFFDPV